MVKGRQGNIKAFGFRCVNFENFELYIMDRRVVR